MCVCVCGVLFPLSVCFRQKPRSRRRRVFVDWQDASNGIGDFYFSLSSWRQKGDWLAYSPSEAFRARVLLSTCKSPPPSSPISCEGHRSARKDRPSTTASVDRHCPHAPLYPKMPRSQRVRSFFLKGHRRQKLFAFASQPTGRPRAALLLPALLPPERIFAWEGIGDNPVPPPPTPTHPPPLFRFAVPYFLAAQTIMTARQLLSILRLSQALARVRFLENVTSEEVDEVRLGGGGGSAKNSSPNKVW